MCITELKFKCISWNYSLKDNIIGSGAHHSEILLVSCNAPYLDVVLLITRGEGVIFFFLFHALHRALILEPYPYPAGQSLPLPNLT